VKVINSLLMGIMVTLEVTSESSGQFDLIVEFGLQEKSRCCPHSEWNPVRREIVGVTSISVE